MRLPLLPLPDGILIPGSVLRTRLPHAVAEGLLDALPTAGQELIVAAVPLLPKPARGRSSDDGKSVNPSSASSSSTDPWLSLDRLHDIGVAARVAHIARRPEDSTWDIALEGRYRLAVREVALIRCRSGGFGDYLVAGEQLDYLDNLTPAVRQQQQQQQQPEATSPEQLKLAGELMAGMQQLLAAMQAQGGGAKAAARAARVLQVRCVSSIVEVIFSILSLLRFFSRSVYK
jgi:hypothetical protein